MFFDGILIDRLMPVAVQAPLPASESEVSFVQIPSVVAREAAADEPAAPKRGYVRRKPLVPTRELSADDKQLISSDWNSLGEHQRTTVNRMALARKHRCSPFQILYLCPNLSQPDDQAAA